MKLHLPVVEVKADPMTTGGVVQRFHVVLSDGWDSRVTYSTATQPVVGQRMLVTIEAEKTE